MLFEFDRALCLLFTFLSFFIPHPTLTPLQNRGNEFIQWDRACNISTQSTLSFLSPALLTLHPSLYFAHRLNWESSFILEICTSLGVYLMTLFHGESFLIRGCFFGRLQTEKSQIFPSCQPLRGIDHPSSNTKSGLQLWYFVLASAWCLIPASSVCSSLVIFLYQASAPAWCLHRPHCRLSWDICSSIRFLSLAVCSRLRVTNLF